MSGAPSTRAGLVKCNFLDTSSTRSDRYRGNVLSVPRSSPAAPVCLPQLPQLGARLLSPPSTVFRLRPAERVIYLDRFVGG